MEPETFTAYIYQIYDHWLGLRYIGSTINSVDFRLKGHENSYRRYMHGKDHFLTSFKVLCNGDYDISILKRVEVISFKELHQIEGKYIRAIDCVNRCVAGRTKKEYEALYHEANKDKINKQHKKHYEANKEKHLERAKAYRDLNKDAIAIKKKVYDEANKHIKAKKITCICGSIFRQDSKATHMRSKKHTHFII